MLLKLSDNSGGAQDIVEAGFLNYAMDLLQSDEVKVQNLTSQVLGNLAQFTSTYLAVLKLRPCKQLVELLKFVLAVWRRLARN